MMEVETVELLQNIPLVNILLGLFFVRPDFEGLEKMLQIFALIDALMIATVCSILSSVDFEEIQKSMARYNDPTDLSWSFCSFVHNISNSVYSDFCAQVLKSNGYARVSILEGTDLPGNPFAMIYGFPQYAIASISLFTMSLLGTLFLYLEALHTNMLMRGGSQKKNSTEKRSSMSDCDLESAGSQLRIKESAADPDKADKAENDDVDDKLPLSWWIFAGPLCFLVFFSMTAGVVTFFFTAHRLIFIKFPAFLMEARGIGDDFAWSWKGDPPHTYSSWSYYAVTLSLGMAVLALSLARIVSRICPLCKTSNRMVQPQPSH